MPVAVSAPPAAPTDPTAGTPRAEPAGSPASPDAVRWGLFWCLLVPAAFAVYGTRAGSATLLAIGLAAVTAACRLLLCRSEHGTARETSLPHDQKPARIVEGARRGGR
ncbi:hypothetical protein [Streptomyces sp. NPDC055749]